MLPVSNKYWLIRLQRTMLVIVLQTCFILAAFSQNDLHQKDSVVQQLNPILVAAIKNPVKPNPQLNQRFKRPNNQLMSWPNYPLTAEQIAARDSKYDRPIGRQIIESVAESYINSILNGRNKKPVATIPKF